MLTSHQCIQKSQELAPYMQENFGVKTMRLFGSMARGDNRDDSDADIYVEMDPVFSKVLGLKSFLQNHLGIIVDLVRKHSRLDSYLLKEIEQDGITIF